MYFKIWDSNHVFYRIFLIEDLFQIKLLNALKEFDFIDYELYDFEAIDVNGFDSVIR